MKKLSILIFVAICMLVLVVVNNMEGKDEKEQALEIVDLDEVEDYEFYSESGGNYGISTSNKIASEVGLSVLEQGGNAVDAAIAASYVLGVVEPFGSGVGGGGGMLIKEHDSESPVFVDYRNMSDNAKEPREDETGIPTFVKGMEYLNEEYGSLPLDSLIDPAIELSRDGAEVSGELASYLESYNYWIGETFEPGYPDGEPLQKGDKIVQPELADVLEMIQKEGTEAFYEYIHDEMDDPLDFDFADIEDIIVEEKTPIFHQVGDYTYYSAPEPFSGLPLVQLMEINDQLDLPLNIQEDREGFIEQGKISNNINSYRINHIADPNFSEMEDGLSEEVIESLIEDDNEYYEEEESISTTHISVVDQEGNVVSVTNTLGNFWGNKHYDLGFFHNSILTNFSEMDSNPNIYEPYKKARTFMAPTIIENDTEILAIGSPGGSRIPQVIAQVLSNYLNGSSLKDAVEEPRYYFENNQIVFEDYLDPEMSIYLSEQGFDPTTNDKKDFFGGINAVGLKEGKVFGVADPRRSGIILEGDSSK